MCCIKRLIKLCLLDPKRRRLRPIILTKHNVRFWCFDGCIGAPIHPCHQRTFVLRDVSDHCFEQKISREICGGTNNPSSARTWASIAKNDFRTKKTRWATPSPLCHPTNGIVGQKMRISGVRTIFKSLPIVITPPETVE